MKKISILSIALATLIISSCKKENLLTPDAAASEQIGVEKSQLLLDYRDKFVGKYDGVSTGNTNTYGQSISGVPFKFVVTKVTSTTNKVKIVVSKNGFVQQSFNAIAATNKLSFSLSMGSNLVRTIKMFKTSTTAVPTHFIYTEQGGFVGTTSKYVVLNPVKS